MTEREFTANGWNFGEGLERSDAERGFGEGLERSEAKRSEVERSGANRSGSERSGAERSEAKRHSIVPSVDAERSGLKRSPPQGISAKPLVYNMKQVYDI